ncbi:hypothetical protein [Umezawaea tangerina]|uniref:Uncharacterized protein n=1 Tax=Umezawaea tangerina TaxID=84725 RepID=A0A2T0SPF4_9PSEU|nr:hypothetical protein [Umezawaea tangerina]PRY35288.1 hypothetical protein CLV43_114206 [Umezawaea tangerina]
MTDTAPPEINKQSPGQPVDLESEVAVLRAEIAALRAGEDDTPVPDDAVATLEQQLYYVNRMTGDERRQWMRHMLELQTIAFTCTGQWRSMGHAQQLANLEGEKSRLQDHVRELAGRPTQWAYEAACEALEKRRVALVAALKLPAETAFCDAVDFAAALSGGAS